MVTRKKPFRRVDISCPNSPRSSGSRKVIMVITMLSILKINHCRLSESRNDDHSHREAPATSGRRRILRSAGCVHSGLPKAWHEHRLNESARTTGATDPPFRSCVTISSDDTDTCCEWWKVLAIIPSNPLHKIKQTMGPKARERRHVATDNSRRMERDLSPTHDDCDQLAPRSLVLDVLSDSGR